MMKKKIILLLLLIKTFNCFGDGVVPTRSIPHYYCTAADERHFTVLVNLIGSIHQVDYENLEQIAVFDLGLSEKQRDILKNIKKVKVCQVEAKHPDICTYFTTCSSGRMVRGWFAWKPVLIKQALDMFPYVLYIDAGAMILRPLDDLFKHIQQNGYFLMTAGPHNIEERITQKVIEKVVSTRSAEEQQMIMAKETFMIDAGMQGFSRAVYYNYVLPVYNLASDLSLFADDGTSRMGLGAGRHDQTLFSIFAHLEGLAISPQGWMELTVDDQTVPFFVHWDRKQLVQDTSIYRSRWDFKFGGDSTKHIRFNNPMTLDIQYWYSVSCLPWSYFMQRIPPLV